jgi:hypothetical protein
MSIGARRGASGGTVKGFAVMGCSLKSMSTLLPDRTGKVGVSLMLEVSHLSPLSAL